MVAASLACLALANHLPRELLLIEWRLSWCAVALLALLVLRRAYQRGFRGFLQPLVHHD
jgi:hypothetical protein